MTNQVSISELRNLLQSGDNTIFIPIIRVPEAEHPIEPPIDMDWDPRLDRRFATLEPAIRIPGQGYWKLIKAVWMDEKESGGRHHIFMELIDKEGRRVIGQKVRISWGGGTFIEKVSEVKPGEPWALNFDMYATAPAYSAAPLGVADKVNGMGLGSLEQPDYNIHTSYGLTWQWVER